MFLKSDLQPRSSGTLVHRVTKSNKNVARSSKYTRQQIIRLVLLCSITAHAHFHADTTHARNSVCARALATTRTHRIAPRHRASGKWRTRIHPQRKNAAATYSSHLRDVIIFCVVVVVLVLSSALGAYLCCPVAVTKIRTDSSCSASAPPFTGDVFVRCEIASRPCGDDVASHTDAVRENAGKSFPCSMWEF